MIVSIAVIIITLVPVIVFRGFYLSDNMAIVQVLGGATVSLLMLPFCGLLYLRVRPLRKMLCFLILFFLGHVGVNQLATYASIHQHGIGFIGNMYLCVTTIALMIVPIMFVHYSLLLSEENIDKRYLVCFKNLRYMPLVFLMYGMFYGFSIGRFLIDYYKLRYDLFIMLESMLVCYAVASLVVLVLVLWHARSPFVFLLVQQKRFSKKRRYFAVIGGFVYFALTTFAESVRGNWYTWCPITVTVIVLSIVEWIIIRSSFNRGRNPDQAEPDYVCSINICSMRFLVYNLIVYLLMFAMLIAIPVLQR